MLTSGAKDDELIAASSAKFSEADQLIHVPDNGEVDVDPARAFSLCERWSSER